MRAHDYYTYILTNRPNGTLYTGVTNDLVRRLAEHREGGADSFTRRYNLRRLVWFEHHTDIREAILREKRIKKWNRAWKTELIEALNPDWRDLCADLAAPLPAFAGITLPRCHLRSRGGFPSLSTTSAPPRFRGDDRKGGGGTRFPVTPAARPGEDFAAQNSPSSPLLSSAASSAATAAPAPIRGPQAESVVAESRSDRTSQSFVVIGTSFARLYQTSARTRQFVDFHPELSRVFHREVSHF